MYTRKSERENLLHEEPRDDDGKNDDSNHTKSTASVCGVGGGGVSSFVGAEGGGVASGKTGNDGMIGSTSAGAAGAAGGGVDST